jgi:hypothetical protein
VSARIPTTLFDGSPLDRRVGTAHSRLLLFRVRILSLGVGHGHGLSVGIGHGHGHGTGLGAGADVGVGGNGAGTGNCSTATGCAMQSPILFNTAKLPAPLLTKAKIKDGIVEERSAVVSRAARNQKPDGSAASRKTVVRKMANKTTLDHTIPPKKSAPARTPELNPM